MKNSPGVTSLFEPFNHYRQNILGGSFQVKLGTLFQGREGNGRDGNGKMCSVKLGTLFSTYSLLLSLGRLLF